MQGDRKSGPTQPIRDERFSRGHVRPGTDPDRTVTFTGSSVIKDEVLRLLLVSSSSCCPPSEVKPSPLWVLVPAAVDASQTKPNAPTNVSMRRSKLSKLI